MTIAPATLSDLKKDLAGLPPKQNHTLTAKEVVRAAHPDLVAARASGYTLADLAVVLGKRGVAISASTLGTYLREESPRAASTDGPKTQSRTSASN